MSSSNSPFTFDPAQLNAQLDTLKPSASTSTPKTSTVIHTIDAAHLSDSPLLHNPTSHTIASNARAFLTSLKSAPVAVNATCQLSSKSRSQQLRVVTDSTQRLAPRLDDTVDFSHIPMLSIDPDARVKSIKHPRHAAHAAHSLCDFAMIIDAMNRYLPSDVDRTLDLSRSLKFPVMLDASVIHYDHLNYSALHIAHTCALILATLHNDARCYAPMCATILHAIDATMPCPFALPANAYPNSLITRLRSVIDAPTDT